MSLVRRFIKWNVRLSRGFEGLLPFLEKEGSLGDMRPQLLFASANDVADVGGGMKPFVQRFGIEVGERRYVGMDIDPDELKAAPVGIYTETRVVDLTDPPKDMNGQFDLVICNSTLEHVTDNKVAVASLVALLDQGGRCFIRLPCRKSAFARLNRILPNDLKKRLMHWVFPDKSGDGFPAYYDQCTPAEMRELLNANGMVVLAETRKYWSSYFSFFFPAYAAWRLFTVLQYALDKDYCESFAIVFEKPN